MKSLSLVCIVLSLVYIAQCQETRTDGNGCVWTYMCCVFTEVDGQVSCARMCEPKINCPAVASEEENQSQEEIVEEAAVVRPAIALFSVSSSHICRAGFRLDSKGVCRRALGPEKDRKSE